MTPEQWRRAGQWRSDGGHRLFLRREGEGAPLLLVHGYPTGSHDWHRVWRGLAARRSLIAPDLLGLGFSDKPRRGAYGLSDHADRLERLLAELGIGRVDIVAHDLGVSVVQEMLARRLERPGLAPIGAVAFLNGGLLAEAYRPRLIQRVLASPLGRWLGPAIPRSAFAATLRELFGPATQPIDSDIDAMWSLVCHGQGRAVTHLVGRFWQDRMRLRGRLVGPLLSGAFRLRYVVGMADPNSGAHMARRYRDLDPGADIVTLEGIGHWPQLEAPSEVTAALLAFLDAPPRVRV